MALGYSACMYINQYDNLCSLQCSNHKFCLRLRLSFFTFFLIIKIYQSINSHTFFSFLYLIIMNTHTQIMQILHTGKSADFVGGPEPLFGF